jgi:hypothetical protein
VYVVEAAGMVDELSAGVGRVFLPVPAGDWRAWLAERGKD